MAEGNQLRLDAPDFRASAQVEEQSGKEAFRQAGVAGAACDVQPAEQCLFFLEDVEAVAGDAIIFEGSAAVERARLDEPADECQGGTIVPTKVLEPAVRLLLKEGIELARRRLPERDDFHKRTAGKRIITGGGGPLQPYTARIPRLRRRSPAGHNRPDAPAGAEGR